MSGLASRRYAVTCGSRTLMEFTFHVAILMPGMMEEEAAGRQGPRPLPTGETQYAYQVRSLRSMMPWLVRPRTGRLSTPSRLIRTADPIWNCPPKLSRRDPSLDSDTSV